jgi:galactosyl transferase GMA12/MNN10 family
MRKALATFGYDAAEPLLRLALPTFRRYADSHGYDVIVGSRRCERPASWGKIPLLRELLTRYDFALWIDADALILDGSTDVAAVIPAHAYQAFAVVNCEPGNGESPCLGVWALRAVPRALELLDAIWRQDDLIEASHWEQSALMRLMGWTLEPPFVKTRSSEWDAGTHVLGEEWDALPIFPIGYTPARVRHYAGMSYPQRRYDMETDLARVDGRWPRYWLGQLERRLRSHQSVYASLRGMKNRLTQRSVLR